ncbi:MAG: DNA repair protein RecO [Rhodocyclaceae bacterium]|nr:DNA repair protein RecO [Rhodocyclaceae bacterium]
MAKGRIDGQKAFVLHAHPYSETSLIVDVFSREQGRLPLLARGARRPRSVLRGNLMAFAPLELGWFGTGEVKTLAKAEWLGGISLLSGRCLLLGYYLNELLVKLLPRDDAHPQLFDAYEDALRALSSGAEDAPELRRFEQTLLKELGYGLTLDVDARSGARVVDDREYVFWIERGPVERDDGDDTASVSGKTLLDMVADDYSDARTRFESKGLMRQLIAHHLSGRPLHSRRVFVELQEL